MASGRSFKTDESFLEKLAIGAYGTRRVLSHLEAQGLRPIELERGSTGYKLWKAIKIKRIRVPDILCLANGVRIESRAKTKLVISMSHSVSDEARGWDYGLKNEDYIALVTCVSTGDKPTDWAAMDPVQYIKIKDLREAYQTNHAIVEKAKGAQEGFEIRITWPAAIANDTGTVFHISEDRIQYKRQTDTRIISLALAKKGITLRPLVRVGEFLSRGKILASVVNVTEAIPLGRAIGVNHFLEWLTSVSLPDRYAAAKALSYLSSPDIPLSLLARLQDADEHIYVKLEAAACLMRQNIEEGVNFIRETLKSEYLPHRLEAVIILSEINLPRSAELLQNTLSDSSQDPEIRAGAAWSLGELKDASSLSILMDSFGNVRDVIRIEAARALSKIAHDHLDSVLNAYSMTNELLRPGVAWAISKQSEIQLDDLLHHTPANSLDARQWTAFILGSVKSEQVIGDIERVRNQDPELYFAVTLLWKIMSSWVFNLEEVG
jgi:HEAT repeat protein